MLRAIYRSKWMKIDVWFLHYQPQSGHSKVTRCMISYSDKIFPLFILPSLESHCLDQRQKTGETYYLADHAHFVTRPSMSSSRHEEAKCVWKIKGNVREMSVYNVRLVYNRRRLELK